MTFGAFVITLISGIISGVISTYIVRWLDSKHKNNRHGE